MKKIILSIIILLMLGITVGAKETVKKKDPWIYFDKTKYLSAYYHDPIEIYDEDHYKVFVKWLYTAKGKAKILKDRKKKGLSNKKYVNFGYAVDSYLFSVSKKGYTILTYTDFSITGNILSQSKDMLKKLQDIEKIKWRKVKSNRFMNLIYKNVIVPKIKTM